MKRIQQKWVPLPHYGFLQLRKKKPSREACTPMIEAESSLKGIPGQWVPTKTSFSAMFCGLSVVDESKVHTRQKSLLVERTHGNCFVIVREPKANKPCCMSKNDSKAHIYTRKRKKKIVLDFSGSRKNSSAAIFWTFRFWCKGASTDPEQIHIAYAGRSANGYPNAMAINWFTLVRFFFFCSFAKIVLGSNYHVHSTLWCQFKLGAVTLKMATNTQKLWTGKCNPPSQQSNTWKILGSTTVWSCPTSAQPPSITKWGMLMEVK